MEYNNIHLLERTFLLYFLKLSVGNGLHIGKSYLSYLNKLVDQYNNNCHYFINKKPINADYSAFTGKIVTNPKDPKFKVNDRVIDSVLKTNPWTYKLKDLNGVKIVRNFYEKELLSSI